METQGCGDDGKGACVETDPIKIAKDAQHLAKLNKAVHKNKCAGGNKSYCDGNPIAIAAFVLNGMAFPEITIAQTILTGIYGPPKSPSERMDEAAIAISKASLTHIANNHTIGGPESEGQSIFFNKKEIPGLIKEAESLEPEIQEHSGNFERIVDAGREIGIDRETNLSTTWYTVITDFEDNLITAFPGFPPY